MEMRSLIADISWERTGSELMALLLESAEIKTRKPLSTGLSVVQVSAGVFTVTRMKRDISGLSTGMSGMTQFHCSLFSSRENVRAKLEQIISEYDLCQKFCGMYDTDGQCFHRQVSLCRGACCGEEEP